MYKGLKQTSPSQLYTRRVYDCCQEIIKEGENYKYFSEEIKNKVIKEKAEKFKVSEIKIKLILKL